MMNYPPGMSGRDIDEMEGYCSECCEDESECTCPEDFGPDPDDLYERMREGFL